MLSFFHSQQHISTHLCLEIDTFSFTDKNLPSKKMNIVDMLQCSPSALPFSARVKQLRLSSTLETKIFQILENGSSSQCISTNLTEKEEKELATEVLLQRHAFTRQVFENITTRQAAITIIQNIYLFRYRKIFFGSKDLPGDQERLEALQLFTGSPKTTTIPLAKTFQHLILARVWDRIIRQSSKTFLESSPFLELQSTVEKLNTLRNIYMLLSFGLVRKLSRRINSVYRHSITYEDAVQIGHFGIARAAYRYHPSTGQRFSTYAARWVQKEIQRQALSGRLIRISANLVEQFARALRNDDTLQIEKVHKHMLQATARLSGEEQSSTDDSPTTTPQEHLERKELENRLSQALKTLSPKSKDILQRRYGLGPYLGNEQPVSEICKHYGVTRSSIYQLEAATLKKLKFFLKSDIVKR